jgi:hypothetical protein
LTYLLTGSRADGTAIALSDIDLGVVFGDADIGFLGSITNTARAVALANSQVDLVYASPAMLQTLTYTRFAPVIKDGSVLLGGPDRRPLVGMPPLADYQRDVVAQYRKLLSNIRDLTELPKKLGFPDPNGPFYGYDRPAPAWTGVKSWIKPLPSTVAYGAGVLATVLAGEYVPSSAVAKRLYEERVGDEWTTFVKEVDHYCRSLWQYVAPVEPSDQAHLRRLCEQALDFENHCLEVVSKHG